MLTYAGVELGAMAIIRLLRQGTFTAGSRPIEGVWQWFLAIAALASGAFYEECLYRAFLPEIPLHILSQTKREFPRKHEKELTALVEILCTILFAFSHRYMGIAAVVNALLCGIILRLCYKKSGRILCGTMVHFCYNLTLLVFSALANS